MRLDIHGKHHINHHLTKPDAHSQSSTINAPPPAAALASVPSLGENDTPIAEADIATSGNAVGIHRANVVTVSTDAIVVSVDLDDNSVGSDDAAIQEVANDGVMLAIEKSFHESTGVKVGKARLKGSYKCAASKYIVHAVGPDCRLNSDMEQTTIGLKQCISKSLTLAEAAGAKTFAISPVSTGARGIPRGRAAKAALETVNAFLELTSRPKAIEEVAFVFGDEDGLDELKYRKWFP